MITEKMTELENLIDKELCEYSHISSLYDDKRNVLIKSDLDSLMKIDEQIKARACSIAKLEETRKYITQELGIEGNSISDYIRFAHENSMEIEKSLRKRQTLLAQMSATIASKEQTNIELIKHGLSTVNKLIKIIVNGATKTNQYNNYGKNTSDGSIEISSIVEEV